jgi:ribose 5-phosphate isomerase RpiB
MRVAVVNEISACNKNADILAALQGAGVTPYNAGMSDPAETPALTYIHTGLIAAMLLATDACDLVVGGCGTGQGFLNAAMQYPGVFAGLVLDPLDAWLFSRINAGNCVSLALNKGYGWAGNVNLMHLFEKLFADGRGLGYPPERAQSQAQSRDTLRAVSAAAHRPLVDIIQALPPDIPATLCKAERLLDALANLARDRALAGRLLKLLTP